MRHEENRSELVLFALGFLLLTVAALFPIWAFEYLPILDYPNHMARMFVLTHLDQDPNLQKYYVINFQLIPNLAIDIIVPLLMRFMSVDVAGRVMLSMNTIVYVVGPIMLNYALFRKLGFNSLIIFLTVFNMALFVGLLNFAFGVGLAFIFLACWVLMREKDIRFRLPIFLILPVILFFSHLYGLAVYAIGIAGYELGRTFSKKGTERMAAFREMLLSGLQFLLPACLYFLGPSAPLGGRTIFRPLYNKLVTLPSRLFWADAFPPIGYMDVGASNYWVGVAILIFLLLIIIWAAFRRRFHGWMIIPILGLVVAYLCLPMIIATSAMADYRALGPLSMMVIASIDWTKGSRKAISLISAGFILLFSINLYFVTALWSDMQSHYVELEADIKAIEPGSRVFPLFTGEIDPRACMVQHFPTRAVIERSAMVAVFFANKFQQPVQFAEGKVKAIVKIPFPVGSCITYGQAHHEPSDWNGIVGAYDYVLINRGKLLSEIPMDQLKLVKEGEKFALFQTIH